MCAGRVGVVGIKPRTQSAVAAAKILNSVFTLTADAKGKRKVFLASLQLLRPSTVMDTYVTARKMTRTPGTPRPSLSEKV